LTPTVVHHHHASKGGKKEDKDGNDKKVVDDHGDVSVSVDVSAGDDLPVLSFSKFQEVPWVNFNCVRVGKVKKRQFRIVNSTKKTQGLRVEKMGEKYGFGMKKKVFSIPAGGEEIVDVTWRPVSFGNARTTVVFRGDK